MILTFDDLVARYWRWRRRDVSVNTFNDYDRTFRRFATHLEAHHIDTVAAITTATVEDYLNALHEAGLASKTLANHWTALSALWTYAEAKHGIPFVVNHRRRVELFFMPAFLVVLAHANLPFQIFPVGLAELVDQRILVPKVVEHGVFVPMFQHPASGNVALRRFVDALDRYVEVFGKIGSIAGVDVEYLYR